MKKEQNRSVQRRNSRKTQMGKHSVFLPFVLCLSLMVSMMPQPVSADEGVEPETIPEISAPAEERSDREERIYGAGAEEHAAVPADLPQTEGSDRELLRDSGLTQEDAESVVISRESASLEALDQIRLTAAVYPITCDQTVLWSSTDPDVATVDAAGLVTAVSRGMTVITATAAAAAADGSGISAVCYVTVRSDGMRATAPEQLFSDHPYARDENRFWEFTLFGASNLALSFAPETALGSGDFLVLQFGNGDQVSCSEANIGTLAGRTVAIPGSTVRIWLISDDDRSEGWGFQVTGAREAGEQDEFIQGQLFQDPLALMKNPQRLTSGAGTDLAGQESSEAGITATDPGTELEETAGPTVGASVTLSPNQIELEALDTATITAEMRSGDVSGLTILWSSSDEASVQILDFAETARDETAGTVTGTCTVKGLQRTAEAPVTVTAAAVTTADQTPVADPETAQAAAASSAVTVTNDAAIVTDPAMLESEHPYPRPVSKFWQYTDSSAGSLTLTFDSQTAMSLPADTIIITDGSGNRVAGPYIGNLLAGQTVTVNDSTARIYMQSTESGDGAYGFKVSSVTGAPGVTSYTVTYYANGGSNPPDAQTKEPDVPLTLSPEKPTRSHYEFLGWSTSRLSNVVSWYPGDEYNENADLALYAVWERISTFNSTNRGSYTPYYGPADAGAGTQTYPGTPIELERKEADYDREVLHIRTVEDLIAFSENCSLDTWSDRLPVVLDNDLSLSDVDFQPIPLFNGSFDGRGHSIFDLTLTDPMAPCGLFLETGKDATIKNLSVSGTVAPGGENEMTGGLVGLNRGLLHNCGFSGSVAGKSETGGLVGRNEATGLVSGCRSNATVEGLGRTGGICGVNYGTLLACESSSYVNTRSVDPSLNLDDIDTSSILNFIRSLTTDNAGITTDTGGICGYNEGFIEYCVNSATVGYSRLGYNVGGIAGRTKGYINGSRNEGPVYGRQDVGGIAGQAEPFVEITQAENLTAGLTYRLYALHKSINDAIHDANVLSSDLSGELSGLAELLAPIEEAFRSLSITDPDSVANIRTLIADTIGSMMGEVQSMSDSLGEGSEVMTQDLQMISNNLNAFSGSALQTVSMLANQEDDIIVDDSAAEAAEGLTLGKTADCRNNGEVSGETNVGGIIGVMALENSLDPELDLTHTDALIRNRYSYRCTVLRSVNNGAVSAWHECAGGIVGKADIGYIANCAAYSSVELVDGAYGGGIAGLCYGTVQSCVSRCSLSGAKYVGGILGNGYTSSGKDDKPSTVSGCYSLVEIEERPQFSGAISGGAEGEYDTNYFVPAGFAGLNKLSIQGKAEPILFPVFNSVLSLPDESKTFTLRFVVEGEVVKEVSFDYGASFSREVFPTVETRDGAYAVWDRTDLTNLRFDTTVTAEYRRSETALASQLCRDNGRPVAYVIGQFQEGDALTAEILPVQDGDIREFRPGWFRTMLDQVRSIFREPDYSICVAVTEKLKLSFPEDGIDTHTIHYMSPNGRTEDYRLYLKTDRGYERLQEEVFGSYYSFGVQGNTPEICLVETVQSWWFLLYLAGALIFLLILIRLITLLTRWFRSRPGKPKTDRKQAGLRTWIRNNKKKFSVICAAAAAALLAAALILQSGWLQSGFAGYRILKKFTTEETDIVTDISIRMDSGDLNLSSTVHQISEDGNMIICADQYGIDLYIANGTLYLENGRAFRLVSGRVDQKSLLRLALNAVRRGNIIRETDRENGIVRYSTEISSDAVEEILALYISEDFDAMFHGDKLHAEMDTQNGTLSEIRLTGEGETKSGAGLSFEASLRLQPLSDRPAVPQAVLDAIRSGTEGEARLLTDDALEFFAAWLKNDRSDQVDAAIEVRADCGILSLDDTYAYFREAVDDTDIHCVSNRLFHVYFTDEASCNSAGQILSTAETKLIDAAKMIPVVRELFLKGNYTCQTLGSGKVYTLTVNAEETRNLVENIVPELKELDIQYEDCSLSASIREGELYSLTLSCGGSVRVVTKDADASVEVIVRFGQAGDHTIPAAVRNALVKEN